MEEIWKDIEGYEGIYQVSNIGRVRGLERIVRHSGDKQRKQYGKIIKLLIDFHGYVQVGLYINGKCKKYKVHRLVLSNFIKNIKNKPEVNHIDENKKNNKLENLEWVTRSENELHGTKQERRLEKTNFKLMAIKKSKPVIQYDMDGKLIREWQSIIQIEKKLKYSSGNISSCCNGKIKKIYGCIWKFKEVG